MQNKEKLKTQTSKVECIESGKITTLIQSFFHLTEAPTSHRSSVESCSANLHELTLNIGSFYLVSSGTE